MPSQDSVLVQSKLVTGALQRVPADLRGQLAVIATLQECASACAMRDGPVLTPSQMISCPPITVLPVQVNVQLLRVGDGLERGGRLSPA